ncbi:hypothetical protein [Amycolatopsis nigrescens]|uniref:hypothetical protein n=1 Tax=Amycolatopsis nigrescens TaxID=381445 RepID=UPI0003727376|nr:hypothetical protein [Amycolatopsis nigrescens]
MFSIILTWIGAMLGIALLVTMAFGAFILDFDDAIGDRREKAAELAKKASGSTAA